MAKIADAAHVEYPDNKKAGLVIKTLMKTRLDSYGVRSRLRAIKRFGKLNYVGTYVRCGYKTNDEYGNTYYPTILLDDLTFHGVKVTNHLWLTFTDGFRNIGRLEPGDKISLTGKVGSYYKGYYMDPVEDYQLSSVGNVKILNPQHPHYPLPKNSDLVVGYTMVKNENFYLTNNRPYSTRLVGAYDKWAQKYDKAILPEVTKAEKDAQEFNPLPIGYGGQANRLLKLNTKKRYTFTGVYSNADYDSYRNHFTPTLEINNIRLGNSIVCTNLWFRYNKTFLKLNELHVGDTLQFDARVNVAVRNKGLSGETKYYKLGYPTKAKLLKKKDNDKRYPFPHDPKESGIVVGYIMSQGQYSHKARNGKKLYYDWLDGFEKDNFYIPFREKLWDQWKYKYDLRHTRSHNLVVKNLAMMLMEQRWFQGNFSSKETYLLGGKSTPNVLHYLSINNLTAKKLCVKVYDDKLIDLINCHIMTWDQLYVRVLKFLSTGCIRNKKQNPLNDKLHLVFNKKITLGTFCDKVLIPVVAHDFAICFYLSTQGSKSNQLKKLLKYHFANYKELLDISSRCGKIITINRKQKRFYAVLTYRLFRDNNSKYSKIHLSQNTVKNIKKILKNLTKHFKTLTYRKRLIDIKKAAKYVDCPIINK